MELSKHLVKIYVIVTIIISPVLYFVVVITVRDAFPIITPAYAVHSSPSQAGDASRHAKYYPSG